MRINGCWVLGPKWDICVTPSKVQRTLQKQCKSQRVGENVIFWAGHNCCTHEITVAVATYLHKTGPINSPSRMGQGLPGLRLYLSWEVPGRDTFAVLYFAEQRKPWGNEVLIGCVLLTGAQPCQVAIPRPHESGKASLRWGSEGWQTLPLIQLCMQKCRL